MSESRLSELFERLRREGDSEALGVIFDETAPEILAVARRLTRDAAAAEDILQETFLTAIDRAWSYDARMPLVPWLVGIATIVARRQQRGAARKPDPERVRIGGEAEPSRVAEEGELQQAVRVALDEVPEPYRGVLELHLEGGRTPLEIARELAREPGTVRVQLHRGLDRLRRALPAGLALGAGALVLDARLLAAARGTIVERARERAATLVAQAPKAAAVGAGVLLPVLIVLGFAGGAAFVAAQLGWFGGATGSTLLGGAAQESGAKVVGAAGAPARGATEERIAAEPGVDRRAVAGRVLSLHLVGFDAADGGSVSILVRSQADGVPAIARSLPASPTLALDIAALWVEGQPAPRELFARVDHPAYMPAQAELELEGDGATAALELDVQLVRARGIVRGRVLPAPGEGSAVTAPIVSDTEVSVGVTRAAAPRGDAQPTEVALVRLDGHGLPESAPTEACRPAPDGSFRLRTSFVGEHVVVAARPDLRPASRRVRVAEAVELEPVTLKLDAGASVRARVLTAADAPVAGAYVYLSQRTGEGAQIRQVHVGALYLDWNGSTLEHGSRSARSGSDGGVAFAALAPGPYRARIQPPQAAPGPLLEVSDSDRVRIVDAPALDARLELVAHPLTVELSRAGQPLRGATLVLEGRVGWSSSGASGDDGRIGLALFTEDVITLRCRASGCRDQRLVITPGEHAANEVLHVDLEAGPAWPQLEFVGPEGELAGMRVSITDLAGLTTEALERIRRNIYLDREPFVMAEALEQGVLARRIEPGRYWIQLHPPSSSADPRVDDRVGASLEALVLGDERLEIPVTIVHGGRIELDPRGYDGPDEPAGCKLLDEVAQEVRVSFKRRVLDASGGLVSRRSAAPDLRARSVSQLLRPGRYVLDLTGEHVQRLRVPVLIEAGQTTRVEIAPRAR